MSLSSIRCPPTWLTLSHSAKKIIARVGWVAVSIRRGRGLKGNVCGQNGLGPPIRSPFGHSLPSSSRVLLPFSSPAPSFSFNSLVVHSLIPFFSPIVRTILLINPIFSSQSFLSIIMLMIARSLSIFPLLLFLLLQNNGAGGQDDPEHPDTPELLGIAAEGNADGEGGAVSLRRSKRQWGCPSGCFSPCLNSAQCQRYQLATVCVLGCCCPANAAQTNLTSACDGDPAVAACLNGLCGQGYFCNSRNFCCRCQSGTSPGPCVNNLCPPGYACNTNNFCCSLGSGSVLGPCVNGQCPAGYACGAGNLCYPVTGNSINALG